MAYRDWSSFWCLTLKDLPLQINSRGRNWAEGIQNKTEKNTYQIKSVCSCQTKIRWESDSDLQRLILITKLKAIWFSFEMYFFTKRFNATKCKFTHAFNADFNCVKWLNKRQDAFELIEELLYWLTAQVVHLLLLQQADSIVISIQHQLRFRVLTGHSRAADHHLRLDHLVLLWACSNKCGKRAH